MAQDTKHLYNLDELSDYKIKDGYPNIKGWDVKDIDNRVVGKVDNLLVNKETEQVVYVDVEVDKSIIDASHDPYNKSGNQDITEFVNKDGANHIIIPIGLVGLNTDSKVVFTEIIDHQTFTQTKRYRKGDTVNRSYEEQVLDTYERKSKDRTSERPEHLVSVDHQGTALTEDRIREIVRKEIKDYHNDQNTNWDTETNQEQERRQDDREDGYRNEDDHFYERREFNNDRFKNRTPGL